MKILVTGGAGFVGSNLVDFLQSRHKVTVYDNLSNSSKSALNSLVKKGVQFVKGDILDYETLLESSKGFEMVIHLAAEIDIAKSVLQPDRVKKINVDGTSNVLKCCLKNKIKKVIFSSSAAVYGDSDVVVTEDTRTNPVSPYGTSKMLAENKIRKMAKDDLEYVILRLFNIYGKKQNKRTSDVISTFQANIAKNKSLVIYGDGQQTRDFVSIKDVIHAFDCAIKTNSVGTYNIASGKSISIKELSEIFLDIYNKEIRIKYKPGKKGDIRYSKADITLAKNKLNFNPKRILKKEILDLISVSN